MTARPADKVALHPRSKHRAGYDFAQLIAAHPELAAFVRPNAHAQASIDFADPQAVKALNCALLKQDYGIAWWDIPPQYLCPPVPGRADYLHYLADLLAECNDGKIPRGAQVKVLDIGVGANCIYPLIGHSEYGWSFVGADIDTTALACARINVEANHYSKAIALRQQNDAAYVFKGVWQAHERFALTLCNPPFHASLAEASAGTQRKWHKLGRKDAAGRTPTLNFGGRPNELACIGGEAGFITRMIAESATVKDQCLWFSTLVSRADNLPAIQRALKQAGVCSTRTMEMAQGQKSSRLVAWSYLPPNMRFQDFVA